MKTKALQKGKNSFWQRAAKDIKKNYVKYLIVMPVIIYLIIFAYKPMYGLIIAFKDYKATKGIMGSEWVGLFHFQRFFQDVYFGRLMRNTVVISLMSLVFGFPIPIIFALLLNEVRSTLYKKFIQTPSYLPHFISTVIICSMLREFCYSNGLFNTIATFFGATETKNLLGEADLFRSIYVWSGIWQGFGWSSIIYIASLAGVDQELYEAAKIDGAGRFRQAISITIPSIMPTIIMLFILNMGSVLSVGSEKILLLYNERTYETADVISTYVYRMGLINSDFSYSSAIGLFNTVINVFFLVTTNFLSKKFTDTYLF